MSERQNQNNVDEQLQEENEKQEYVQKNEIQPIVEPHVEPAIQSHGQHTQQGAQTLSSTSTGVNQQNNGMAIAGLILGVASVVLSWIPFIPYITAILAIIFGAIGMKKGNTHRGLAIVGLATGVLTFVIKIGFWLIIILGIFAELSYY